MLLADERHDFIRTFYSRSGRASISPRSSRCTTRWPARRRRACATPRKRRIPDPARPALCRPGIHAVGAGRRCDSSSAATARPSARAFDALYEQRYAHHSPDEPVEMVNIRLGAIGKRPKLEIPAPRRPGTGRRPRRSRRSISAIRRSRCTARSISATDLGAGARDRRPGADPGARHDHGAVRGRPLHGGAVRRADHQRRRRVMAKSRSRLCARRRSRSAAKPSTPSRSR